MFDTGASVKITNDASDFIYWDESKNHPTLSGISSNTMVGGLWMIQ